MNGFVTSQKKVCNEHNLNSNHQNYFWNYIIPLAINRMLRLEELVLMRAES